MKKELYVYGIDWDKLDNYNKVIIRGKDILKQLVEKGIIADRKGWTIKKAANRFIVNDPQGFNRFILYDYKKDDSDIDGLADEDNSTLKTQNSTLLDGLSALEAVSGAVVITVDNDEKIRKYYLAPSQAKVIIPELVEMHVTSSGTENNLPVYQLTPAQSTIMMKRFEEMNIPEANFEDLKSEAGSPKPGVDEVHSTLNTQNSTQLADNAGQDVIIVIEGKDKIHKYVLTPARAQSIIQQVIALSKETAVVTKGVSDVQEIKLPDNMVAVLITENNEEKHYILTDEDAEEIKGKLQTENKVFESQANVVKSLSEDDNSTLNTQNSTQLEGLADKDPVVQKATEINRAMKRLFNSLSNPEEPYYYIALSKEYKKKGKIYESYYEPSWKKQKQSADPSHPAVSSVQESTVAGWLRRNFGLNFYKFKKNPIEEANTALGKKEKKAGSRKHEVRSREPELPKREEEIVTKKQEKEKSVVDTIYRKPYSGQEHLKPRMVVDVEKDYGLVPAPPPKSPGADSDAELLAKILKRVENM